MGIGGQRHTPATILPGKRPGTHCTGSWLGLRNPLYWELAWSPEPIVLGAGLVSGTHCTGSWVGLRNPLYWELGWSPEPIVLGAGLVSGTHCTGSWLGLSVGLDCAKNLANTGTTQPVASKLYRLSDRGPQATLTER